VYALGLQPRAAGTPGDGHFDLSNLRRIGRTEVELVNTVIVGVAALVELEQRLDSGEAVSAVSALRALAVSPPPIV